MTPSTSDAGSIQCPALVLEFTALPYEIRTMIIEALFPPAEQPSSGGMNFAATSRQVATECAMVRFRHCPKYTFYDLKTMYYYFKNISDRYGPSILETVSTVTVECWERTWAWDAFGILSQLTGLQNLRIHLNFYGPVISENDPLAWQLMKIRGLKSLHFKTPWSKIFPALRRLLRRRMTRPRQSLHAIPHDPARRRTELRLAIKHGRAEWKASLRDTTLFRKIVYREDESIL